MRGFTFGAIEPFAQNELIALTTGGQAMQTYVTKVSLVIALTAGAIYHIREEIFGGCTRSFLNYAPVPVFVL
jgi:hypothetical protein